MSGKKKSIKQNNTFRLISVFLMTFISGIAVNIDPERVASYKGDTGFLTEIVKRFSVQLGEVGLSDMVAVVLVMLVFFYVFIYRKMEFSLTAFWISFVLAVFYIIGISYSSFYDSRFIANDKYQLVIAFTTLIGVMFILYSILALLYDVLDRLKNISITKKNYTGIYAVIDKHFFLFCFIVLFVVWILCSIPFFPGSVPFDGRKQLNQYFGYMEMTTHHPYYSTLIIGAIYEFGRFLFGPSGGGLLFVILQTLVGAAVFSKICCFMKDCTRGMLSGVVSLIFFTINPLMWTNMQAVHKDTIGFTAFALFMLEFMRIYLNKDVSKKTYAWLGISAVIHCLFRHEGKYLIFIAFMILLILVKDRSKLWRPMIISALVFLMLNSVVVDGLKINPGNRIEKYSIVVQQVSRYVKIHRKEITDTEKTTIGRVLKYHEIASAYDPEVADPVKNHYQRGYTDDDWKAFIKQWLVFFRRDPKVYFDAAIDEMFGYVYPFYFYRGMAYYQLYIKGPIGDFDQNVVYSEYFTSESFREFYKRLIYLWDKIPILSVLINCGVYTWLLIVIFGAVLRSDNRKSALIFVIPAVSLLICFCSPVNGYARYMMREITAIPLYILLMLLCYTKGFEKTGIEEADVKPEYAGNGDDDEFDGDDDDEFDDPADNDELDDDAVDDDNAESDASKDRNKSRKSIKSETAKTSSAVGGRSGGTNRNGKKRKNRKKKK